MWDKFWAFCTFFFSLTTGDNYWVFDAERKITGPDSVRQLGLPVADIQAALKWEEDNTEKVYLLKSFSYWPFNPQLNRVDDVHPRSMHDWKGVPSHIDAAFRDSYGEYSDLEAFKGSKIFYQTQKRLWNVLSGPDLELSFIWKFGLRGMHNWDFKAHHTLVMIYKSLRLFILHLPMVKRIIIPLTPN